MSGQGAMIVALVVLAVVCFGLGWREHKKETMNQRRSS